MIDPSAVSARVGELPCLPQLVMELQQSMQSDDIDAHALAARITLDSALAAKILQLANSSFYGVSNRITTVQQAVSVLGFHSIRTLLTTCSITSSFTADEAGARHFTEFWRHAIATAVCARVLAPHLALPAENAFTAGLLHDIGILVLVTEFPVEYQQVLAYRKAHDSLLITAELAVLGIDHARVGCALAAHWRFPAAIEDAVGGHHQDGFAGQPLTLTGLICLASIVAHALDLSGSDAEQVPPLPLLLWQAVPLSDSGWQQVFADIDALFDELCQMLLP
ncbi:HDOD domain-containing protein [Massilia sp. PWRC2]|uniref:HDOD domain-containing protein n=1 Tax=Massilia sp. PWRC2 TaxID=2804626 RepID=UPI003CF0F215